MTHIKVKAGDPNNKRVVLWERHPDHPNGEVFIAGGKDTHTVARTPQVAALLANGRLVEVKTKRPAQPTGSKK